MKVKNELFQPLPRRLVGKPFGVEQLSVIQQQIIEAIPCNREEIARRVCRQLQWYGPGGAPQQMSAKVALLRLHRQGLIELPAPKNGNSNGKKINIVSASVLSRFPQARVVAPRVDLLENLHLRIVQKGPDSQLYNALIEKYHYLGYTAMAGAQIRYLIADQQGVLGVIGFGASAWKVACRDNYIGWTRQQRHNHLHGIINNWRFLILPWVRCDNLASKILSLSAHRLPDDFYQRYGYAPVLLETFVQQNKYTGACYRAANWCCLGNTKGRGKKGQLKDPRLPIKTVWVYPLAKNFRNTLCAPVALETEQHQQ